MRVAQKGQRGIVHGDHHADVAVAVLRSQVLARALGLQATHGQLGAGFQADFVVWDLAAPNELAYWFGRNPCRRVVQAGIERKDEA